MTPPTARCPHAYLRWSTVAPLALTACAPFGPNASGRWLGTASCSDTHLELLLELVEETGATGELRGWGWSSSDAPPHQSDIPDEAIQDKPIPGESEGSIEGHRHQRDLSLRWDFVGSDLSTTIHAQLQGDQLIGEAEDAWTVEGTTCTVRLDR